MYCKVNRGDVTYTIRPMIVADCENVAGLFNAYLPADKQVDRDSLEIILIRQEYQGLVMTKPVEPGGESIVGAMMLQVGPGYRYIMSMTIEKAHRRQGLASAMIDLLKQVAVDYSLSLHVDAVTPEAFMLFQSRGFQKKKKEHYPIYQLMFIGDLHNDPSTFAWQVRQTEPEYEATETEAAEEPAAGNELDGV